MKKVKIITLILISILIFVGIFSMLSALQFTLSYKWEKGKKYNFAAQSEDVITFKSGLLGLSNTIKATTTTKFGLKIVSVFSDGSAEAIFYIKDFEVKDDKGRKLASLADIPENAVKTRIMINKKGNFKFYEVVYLVIEDGTNMLVSAKITDDSATASGQVGDTKVEVYAEFDKESGEIKAGYSIKNIEKTKKVVEIKKESPKIDLLPVQFLELLKLPDGSFSEGDSFVTTIADYKITIKILSIINDILKMRNKIETMDSLETATDKQFDNLGNDLYGNDDDNSGEFGDSFGAEKMKLKINGDIELDFDLGKSIFKQLTGEIKTESDFSMMTMKTESKIKMKLVD